MKTILTRNDHTSLFCAAPTKHSSLLTTHMKAFEIMVASTLIVVGLLLMLQT